MHSSGTYQEKLDSIYAKLIKLIEGSADIETIQVAYFELIFLRENRNKVRAAKKLGIDRRTIYRWLKNSDINSENLKIKDEVLAVECGEGIILARDHGKEDCFLVRFHDDSIKSFHYLNLMKIVRPV